MSHTATNVKLPNFLKELEKMVQHKYTDILLNGAVWMETTMVYTTVSRRKRVEVQDLKFHDVHIEGETTAFLIPEKLWQRGTIIYHKTFTIFNANWVTPSGERMVVQIRVRDQFDSI